jgi:hypothetical protein
MNRLTWWFRVVGAFYLLLALMNFYWMFINPQIIQDTIPYATDENIIRAFVEGWSPFAFEIFGIGTFLLWASRNPLKFSGVVWLIAWLEIWHGVVDDIFLISRGYDPVFYIGFIVVHLIIAVTGILFLRQARPQ